MDAGFYRAFEDKHRGSRTLITQRLLAYEPFLTPFTQQMSVGSIRALDIGCGRGEWVELLLQHGFQAQGIDLDQGMIQDAEQLGLPLKQGDGLEYLAQQSDQCLDVVSAFHVVEHIPFQSVMDLARHALRVLKPGGLLILETPNPENVVVASNNFYLDPSHIKPIPPALLLFALEYAGFERVRIVRLNESLDIQQEEYDVSLYEVLAGVSPDYAVVAQKKAEYSLMQQWDNAFAEPFGVDLGQLARRYQQQHDTRLHDQHHYVLQQLQQQNQRIQNLSQEYQQQQQELQRLQGWFDRYTLAGIMLRGARLTKGALKKGLRFFLKIFDYQAEKNPQLRHFVRAKLRRVPALQQRVHQVTQAQQPAQQSDPAPTCSQARANNEPLGQYEQQLLSALQHTRTHHRGK